MMSVVIRIVIASMLCLITAEITVRLAGFTPAPAVSAEPDAQLNIEDPSLGWQNRPEIRQTYRTPAAPPHTITVLANGARASRDPNAARQQTAGRDVIFIGCSFTFGFGLKDEETFAWKVQAAQPAWRVHNFGVNGYGTCQSYGLLKTLFERHVWRKPVVIYGFIDDHENRNVADYAWHYALSRMSTRRNVLLPSCALDESGSIVFNALRPYPQFPLRRTLATISLLEVNYLKLVGAALAAQKQRVTEQLLVEMEAFAAARSGTFAVLLFDPSGSRSSYYREFLERRGIPALAVAGAGQNPAQTLSQADGHPNARMTDIIAQRVVGYLSSLGE
jgi:hypothetical protein